VPDALAVVGFGDAPAAAWAANDLTTVGLPVERMIDAAVETLVAEAAPAEPRLTVIKAGLVRRATVRLVPPARS
jgi:DNA-binding LacI/PurR family transcriptional regulator